MLGWEREECAKAMCFFTVVLDCQKKHVLFFRQTDRYIIEINTLLVLYNMSILK